jgi:hypothetical protein
MMVRFQPTNTWSGGRPARYRGSQLQRAIAAGQSLVQPSENVQGERRGSSALRPKPG